ncbi:hypothetical protein NAC44_20915 [Allorhizobium sp. BGMRC 0089]|uniref:hypothetical protein n=1 Tax=Allorhizobium sonneratiae TaxID=2934936 RepID=UPI0020333A02|nr:hypothetical protein [Allorhizobium sonneratiae]MCM2294792.1 hypothetical protein [Allorhizobium sonneratiae]
MEIEIVSGDHLTAKEIAHILMMIENFIYSYRYQDVRYVVDRVLDDLYKVQIKSSSVKYTIVRLLLWRETLEELVSSLGY